MRNSDSDSPNGPRIVNPEDYREDWLSAYLDDELPAPERAIVEARLKTDSAAKELMVDLQRVRGLVACLPKWHGTGLQNIDHITATPQSQASAESPNPVPPSIPPLAAPADSIPREKQTPPLHPAANATAIPPALAGESPRDDRTIASAPGDDQPVTEEPVTEEPVTEEPVTEEPVAQEPVAEEPVAEEPVAEESVLHEPVTEQPAAEQSGIALPHEQFAASEANLQIDEEVGDETDLDDQAAADDEPTSVFENEPSSVTAALNSDMQDSEDAEFQVVDPREDAAHEVKVRVPDAEESNAEESNAEESNAEESNAEDSNVEEPDAEEPDVDFGDAMSSVIAAEAQESEATSGRAEGFSSVAQASATGTGTPTGRTVNPSWPVAEWTRPLAIAATLLAMCGIAYMLWPVDSLPVASNDTTSPSDGAEADGAKDDRAASEDARPLNMDALAGQQVDSVLDVKADSAGQLEPRVAIRSGDPQAESRAIPNLPAVEQNSAPGESTEPQSRAARSQPAALPQSPVPDGRSAAMVISGAAEEPANDSGATRERSAGTRQPESTSPSGVSDRSAMQDAPEPAAASSITAEVGTAQEDEVALEAMQGSTFSSGKSILLYRSRSWPASAWVDSGSRAGRMLGIAAAEVSEGSGEAGPTAAFRTGVVTLPGVSESQLSSVLGELLPEYVVEQRPRRHTSGPAVSAATQWLMRQMQQRSSAEPDEGLSADSSNPRQLSSPRTAPVRRSQTAVGVLTSSSEAPALLAELGQQFGLTLQPMWISAGPAAAAADLTMQVEQRENVGQPADGATGWAPVVLVLRVTE